MLLANDIADKIAEISDWPAWQAVKADPVRATALLSMAFQMGAAGLAGFKNSLKLVEQKRWAEAAANMMLSKWAKQTPERAARVTKMIETGAYPAVPKTSRQQKKKTALSLPPSLCRVITSGLRPGGRMKR